MAAPPMNVFQRHVATRVVDYAWAYRLRIRRVGRASDAGALRALREPQGPGSPQGPGFAQGPTARPVLLLPGVYETWHFLEAAGKHLNQLGHPVFVVPTFGRNIRPIPDMAQLAADFLEQQNLRDVAIVAHSKGGLIGKTLMLTDVGEARVASMVALNTPFAGSDYAHLIPIRTLREFVPTHETIVALSRAAEVNHRITSVYGSWDPIIPNGSVLDGATNHEVPITGHFRILDHPGALDLVARAVSGA